VLALDFGLDVPTEMGGNYGLLGYFSEVLVLDTFYPAVAVYDQQGWDIDAPARSGDLTYYDASFYRVRVSAPKKLTLVASGIEVGREVEGRRQVVTLAAGPARDFYLAASERFVRESAQIGQTTVHSYASAENREGARRALEAGIDALESFGARLGPYPYTEMDLASTPMAALGIEYPGTMGLSLALYNPEAEVDGLPAHVLLETVVAHEVAHQWFYNAVGNDQQGEPWVDEAVVQYVTGLYYHDVHGSAAAKSYRSSWLSRWDRVDRAEIPIGLRAGDYAPNEYSPIVYGRGPFFLMALEQEMGQPDFERFLREYYEQHKWRIGTTESFRQVAEEHCGCDLGPLFEQWVYKGSPG
jgi:aminopeptidase N